MIIAFTGAGISKASGIPTFDEQGDLRIKLDRNFATYHRKEFNSIMQQLVNTCKAAEPNDAHKALAEYDIPIITMNIDGLHTRTGSKNVVEVHGNAEKNNVVLYGDAAPKYTEALDIVDRMCKDDILLIVGTSFILLFLVKLNILPKVIGLKLLLLTMTRNIKLENSLKKIKLQLEIIQTL